jgi:hypothetical protein
LTSGGEDVLAPLVLLFRASGPLERRFHDSHHPSRRPAKERRSLVKETVFL